MLQAIRSGCKDVLETLRIEHPVGPGFELVGCSIVQALARPLGQGAEATGELALKQKRLALQDAFLQPLLQSFLQPLLQRTLLALTDLFFDAFGELHGHFPQVIEFGHVERRGVCSWRRVGRS